MATAGQARRAPAAAERIGQRTALAAAALLALMFALGLGAILHESPTNDEMVHLPAGVSYWRLRDLRMNLEHPPLLKLLAAAPVLLLHPNFDPSSREWRAAITGNYWPVGDAFFKRWNHDPVRLIFFARLPMLLLTLLMGWVIFQLGRALGGDHGGLLSLCVFATAPFWLAFGPLDHTDMGVALFSLLAAWEFGRLWATGNVVAKAGWRFGLALAGALLSKFSAGLLLPAFVIAGLWLSARGRAWWPWRSVARGFGLACVVTYVVELFFGWNTPPARAFSSMGHIRFPRLLHFCDAHALISHLLLPVLLYGHGVASVLIASQKGAFILGHRYEHGVWFYFPVLFILKMAPGFLALLALLVALLAVHFMAPHARHAPPLLPAGLRPPATSLVVTLVVFSFACIASPLDIGVRHLSVPIALAMVLLALFARAECLPRNPRARRRVAVVGLALAASCIATAAWAFPNDMSYYNWFRLGCPKFTIAADANLDWGQSLPALRAFVSRHHIHGLGLDFYGDSTVRAYLPHYRRWRCEPQLQSRWPVPKSGWVAVTAGQMLAYTDPPNAEPPVSCAWLFAYRHWTLAGGAAFVFHIPRLTPAAQAKGIR